MGLCLIVEVKAIKPKKVIANRVEREKTSNYKPRGLRWSGVKATDKKTLSRFINVDKNYNFQPYYIYPSQVTPLLLYSHLSKEV